MRRGVSPHGRAIMPKSCPECGSAVELAEQEARLLTGTCPGCSKSITLVTGVRLEPGSPERPVAVGEAGTAPGGSSPECPECGGPLSIAIDGHVLTAECDSCDTTIRFFQDRGEAAPDESRRGRSVDRPFRQDRGDRFRPMNARPCRQCGAPLRFTTDESGILTGECDSCGNRFTLPPRSGRDGDRGAGRGRGRPPGRYGSGGGYRYAGRPRGARPEGGRYRPRDEESGPPRRRRRRDSEDST